MEEQQIQEQTYYTREGKKVPPFEKFMYRNILHVGDLYESYDDLVARTIQKYKNLDAGLNADGTPKVRRAASGYVSPRDSAGSTSELIAQITALKEQVAQLTKPPEPDPDTAALQAERDALLAQIEAMSGDRPQAEIDAAGRGDVEEEVVLPYSDEAVEQDAQSATDGATAQAPTAEKGQCPKCGKAGLKNVGAHQRFCKAKAA